MTATCQLILANLSIRRQWMSVLLQKKCNKNNLSLVLMNYLKASLHHHHLHKPHHVMWHKGNPPRLWFYQIKQLILIQNLSQRKRDLLPNMESFKHMQVLVDLRILVILLRVWSLQRNFKWHKIPHSITRNLQATRAKQNSSTAMKAGNHQRLKHFLIVVIWWQWKVVSLMIMSVAVMLIQKCPTTLLLHVYEQERTIVF